MRTNHGRILLLQPLPPRTRPKRDKPSESWSPSSISRFKDHIRKREGVETEGERETDAGDGRERDVKNQLLVWWSFPFAKKAEARERVRERSVPDTSKALPGDMAKVAKCGWPTLPVL